MPGAVMDNGALGIVLGTTGSRGRCRLSGTELSRARELATPGSRAASSIGGLVKIEVADSLLIGMLVELSEDHDRPGMIDAEVEYVGEGPRGGDGNLTLFERGVTIYPHPGDMVRLVSHADQQQIFSPHGVPHIQIGNVYPTEDIRAPILFDRLLSRHFAIVGSSGTGKSSMAALLIHRIIAANPQSHVVILDPHGEYTQAFGSIAKIWNVDNLRIPYWMMNHEEHCEAFVTTTGESRAIDRNILAKCLHKARLRNPDLRDAANVTADSPISYQLDDLIDALQDEVGRLEKPAEAQHYTHLQLTIEQFFADRRFRFIFDPELWSSSLTALLGDLLRIPVEGKPLSIVDLAGVPSEIVSVVVSTLARLVFDYAVWAPREQRIPVLIICEEAHRYLPQMRSASDVSAERQLDRIAREGRKYGVGLGLITQRPSELSETALSQCGTVISMRLNNQRDQDQMRAILSEGARSYVDVVPALPNRECIISGEAVTVPMHVLIDTLPATETPASEDPIYSERWNEESPGTAMLDEAVRRWRDHG